MRMESRAVRLAGGAGALGIGSAERCRRGWDAGRAAKKEPISSSRIVVGTRNLRGLELVIYKYWDEVSWPCLKLAGPKRQLPSKDPSFVTLALVTRGRSLKPAHGEFRRKRATRRLESGGVEQADVAERARRGSRR
ncbi:uncharacterized protein K452DRAFT_65549 [Aplosporella prunicola CBS 121167]|uniref:Uncharacterized protein n=1 Tax=Aplosporella prunicola CBS 121167 TaxID=1176127 RepID=A0A6A6BRL5_9PEZI|nr:uncharacterized protein K452DRAFT_65549 [Aplosporella prunicola CBS 121167]KAF2146428.1 hypothetical protein K452DRAFT_65549 [Aplosporella prunicola CBS 121167]